jgi:hypothetical protein
MKNASPAQQRRGFQIHAIVFVAAMVIMFAINMIIGPPFWAAWALASWGIGLGAHWLSTPRPAA